MTVPTMCEEPMHDRWAPKVPANDNRNHLPMIARRRELLALGHDTSRISHSLVFIIVRYAQVQRIAVSNNKSRQRRTPHRLPLTSSFRAGSQF